MSGIIPNDGESYTCAGCGKPATYYSKLLCDECYYKSLAAPTGVPPPWPVGTGLVKLPEDFKLDPDTLAHVPKPFTPFRVEPTFEPTFPPNYREPEGGYYDSVSNYKYLLMVAAGLGLLLIGILIGRFSN